MYKDKFKKLITVLDKEIEAYSKLKELFEEKKELLKTSQYTVNSLDEITII